MYHGRMKNRDTEYLAKLRDYYSDHRVLPSFSGIANLVGLSTTSAVSMFVKRMKSLGYLDSTPDRRLQPGRRFFEREIVDTVRAGVPEPANDVQVQTLDIDAYLIDNPSQTILLTVKGDSMVDAGLMPGDMLVVKKNVPINIGAIVVALVDGEPTVKYLEKDRKGFYLRPGNQRYTAIRPKSDLELIGVVTGSFRKY
jgi:repressor LexA